MVGSLFGWAERLARTSSRCNCHGNLELRVQGRDSAIDRKKVGGDSSGVGWAGVDGVLVKDVFGYAKLTKGWKGGGG